MLKITENLENGKTVRLRLDGTLSNQTFDELTHAFVLHRDGTARTIILDMAGVDFINGKVARKLVDLCCENLRIINCSPYITTLLETIAKEGTE